MSSAERKFLKDAPLTQDGFRKKELRKQVKVIAGQLHSILKKSKVALPPYVDLDISYHYGIEKFYEQGAVLVKILNREYSKILLVMFPGQSVSESSSYS